MKVAVLGITGFIGRNIARKFLREGIKVVGVSRNPSKVYEEMGGEVETKSANIISPHQISDAIKGCDALINCVGIIREKGENTFEGVHIQGVINTIHALKENGIKRFIHISALGTGRGIKTRYFQTKEMGEKYIRESGLEWTIFRAGVVIGEDGGIYKKIRGLSLFPFLILPDMRNGRIQAISVEDLSKAVFLSTVERRALNEVVELGGIEMSMDELILRILKNLGKRRIIFRTPSEFFISLLKIGERILNRSLPISSDEIIMALQDITCNPSEIERLGISPKDPFKR